MGRACCTVVVSVSRSVVLVVLASVVLSGSVVVLEITEIVVLMLPTVGESPGVIGFAISDCEDVLALLRAVWVGGEMSGWTGLMRESVGLMGHLGCFSDASAVADFDGCTVGVWSTCYVELASMSGTLDVDTVWHANGPVGPDIVCCGEMVSLYDVGSFDATVCVIALMGATCDGTSCLVCTSVGV